MWIGLSMSQNAQNEKTWKWVDGTVMMHRFMLSIYINESLIIRDQTLKWINIELKRMFISWHHHSTLLPIMFACFSYWGPGEPNNYTGNNEECVEIQSRDQKKLWNDLPCSHMRHWICEKKIWVWNLASEPYKIWVHKYSIPHLLVFQNYLTIYIQVWKLLSLSWK